MTSSYSAQVAQPVINSLRGPNKQAVISLRLLLYFVHFSLYPRTPINQSSLHTPVCTACIIYTFPLHSFEDRSSCMWACSGHVFPYLWFLNLTSIHRSSCCVHRNTSSNPASQRGSRPVLNTDCTSDQPSIDSACWSLLGMRGTLRSGIRPRPPTALAVR